MSKEAMKLALEALNVAEHFVEEYAASKYYFAHIAAKAAIEEALAKQEQGETVALPITLPWDGKPEKHPQFYTWTWDEFVSGGKWRMNKNYARTYKREQGKDVYVLMHRMIAGAKQGEIVDHINRIKTDNRRENLRIVSALTNCLNRNPNLKKSSKYKGVTKQGDGWQVYVDGKYVGFFKFETDAALAYDEKIIQVFGGLAPTNKELGLL